MQDVLERDQSTVELPPLTAAEKRDARRAARALKKLEAEEGAKADDSGSVTVAVDGKSATVTGDQLAAAAHRLRVHGLAQEHAIPSTIADDVAKETNPTVVKPAATNDQLLAFVQRIENINREIAETAEDRREIFNEAKNLGFDVPTLRKIVSLRAMEEDKRLQAEALLATYMHAVGLAVQTEMKF